MHSALRSDEGRGGKVSTSFKVSTASTGGKVVAKKVSEKPTLLIGAGLGWGGVGTTADQSVGRDTGRHPYRVKDLTDPGLGSLHEGTFNAEKTYAHAYAECGRFNRPYILMTLWACP